MKPPLILDEEKLQAGIDNPSYDFAVNLKADLITVLEFIIANEDNLKIDLGSYQIKKECKLYECGTFRCVAGWWAYWLGVPILSKNYSHTLRFENIFCNENLFLCFEKPLYYDCNDDIIDRREVFFGCSEIKTLPERLKIAQSLEFSNKLKK